MTGLGETRVVVTDDGDGLVRVWDAAIYRLVKTLPDPEDSKVFLIGVPAHHVQRLLDAGWSIRDGELVLKRDDAALQGGKATEQRGDTPADPFEIIARLSNVITHGLGERQVVGDRTAEGDEFHGSKAPYSVRAVTRYVAGAHLTALRWLQGKAWVRRRALNSRASDTTKVAGQAGDGRV